MGDPSQRGAGHREHAARSDRSCNMARTVETYGELHKTVSAEPQIAALYLQRPSRPEGVLLRSRRTLISHAPDPAGQAEPAGVPGERGALDLENFVRQQAGKKDQPIGNRFDIDRGFAIFADRQVECMNPQLPA